MQSPIVRIAAIADLHYTAEDKASLVPIVTEMAEAADIVLICGDLTHHGLAEEAIELAKDLSAVRAPIIAVLGNHDCHSDQQEEIKRALKGSPIQILDGDAVEVRGIGFAGVKGFASGFGRRVLDGSSEVARFHSSWCPAESTRIVLATF